MTARSPAKTEAIAVVLFRCGGKAPDDPEVVLLMSDEEGCVRGFASVGAARAHFEDAYRQKHAQSYEGSMSACIHHMMYRPSVVTIRGTEDARRLVQLDDEGRTTLQRHWGVAGGVRGFVCGPAGLTAWEAGCKPRLV